MFGRKTYELFQQYRPDVNDSSDANDPEVQYANWYRKAQKIVLSNSREGLNVENLTAISDDQLLERIHMLKSEAGQKIVFFGSPTAAQKLTDLRLIDEYLIFINPVSFRSGIPLFSQAGELTRLVLTDSSIISNGEVALRYRLKE